MMRSGQRLLLFTAAVVAAASDASHMGSPAVSGASRTGTPSPAAPLKADDWSTGVEVDVEEFGAVADGKTECSAAFNAALRNVSSRGGGIVHARGKGGVYVVQPILLQNHTALQIAAGSFVNATTRNCPGKGFPTLVLPRPPQCGGPENTSTYPPCGTVLFAANVHNFSVRGGGSLDGGGLAFDGPPYTHPKGALMQFVMSSDAVVEDLRLFNSANVHIAPVYSQRMQFRRLYLYSDFAGAHHKNTDGFNPYSSSDLSLMDSFIHNGDDCIAVKSGKQPAAWTCDIPSENILIQNVTCAGSHGLTIGSEVAGGIRNVSFLNMRIHGADGHPSSGAIKFKLPCGRGAYVKDVLYENITASDVASGIMLAGGGASCAINGTTVVSNVTIRNVHAQKIAGPAFAIDGYSVEGRPASYAPFSITLQNVTMLTYAQLGTCSHATVRSSGVTPAVPTKDASCVVSSVSSDPP
jgi:polygalacturonase